MVSSKGHHTTSHISTALLTLWVLAISCLPLSSTAQDLSDDPRSMRELLQSDEEQDQLIEEKTSGKDKDLKAGRTPLEAMLAMQAAITQGDYERATDYMDLRYLPDQLKETPPTQLLRSLAIVFNQQTIVDLTSLSDSPEGHLDDDLPAYRDLLGTVQLAKTEIPVYLQRIPDGAGGKVWRLSNASMARIPEMWEELGHPEAVLLLGDWLPEFRFLGMQNWQLVLSIIFLIVSWPLARLVSNLLLWAALKIPNSFPHGIERFFKGSVSFFLYIAFVTTLMRELGLSLTARIVLESSGLDYIAWTVLLLGVLSLIRDHRMRKMEREGRGQYAALLKPLTTIIKFFVVTIIALFWAERAGYNMSTVIAGLGVGSLAVALAAQKTLENVIGAATLYAARPVNPGDFCRFGATMGIVEEIGLRSTLIRTLNRTLVVIPNSVFSSIEVENYSVRDRIRFFRQTHLQMADAEQFRFILAETRKLFYSHPMVIQDTVSIRLERIEQATVIMRLDAGIKTNNYQEYLAVAEDLNLRFIELVHAAGAAFSGPGQVINVRNFKNASSEELAEIEAKMSAMRSADRLPFPDYTASEKDLMSGSLDYPPKGSPP